jgi:O-antigen ligase
MTNLTSTETIAEADPEGSAEGRWRIAQTAWRIWLDNPILGTGLNSYGEMNYRYTPDLGHRDAHNTYLSLAAELGLPGLALWLTCVWLALRHFVRNSDRLRADNKLKLDPYWIYRSLIAFLVAGLFGTFARLNLLYFTLALLWLSVELSSDEPIPSKALRRAGLPKKNHIAAKP